MPPGRDLRVPATLPPAWGVESLRRVRTDVVEVGDGSLRVAVEYDLIPFEVGLAATPQLEMTSGEAEAGGDRVRVEDVPMGNTDPVGAAITQNTQNTQDGRNGARTGTMVGADSGRRRANAREVVAEVEPAGPDEPGEAATSGGATDAGGAARSREAVQSAGAAQPGEAVPEGESSGIPEASGADGRPRDRLVIAGRRVFVTSPILLDDIARGLRPRPPADVVGFSWNVPAVSGASLLSLLLLGVVTAQTREWLAARAAAGAPAEAPPETPAEWRERALAELDRLLARGHHRAGRLRDFYEGAGDVIRAYVAHFDPSWSRSRTSTELMRDLVAAPGWPDPDALAGAMGRGEVAKFAAVAGMREGAAAAAERDWRTMRAWVDASGTAPAFARMREAIAGERAGDPVAEDREDGAAMADPGQGGREPSGNRPDIAGASAIDPRRDGPSEWSAADTPDAAGSTRGPQ